MLSPGEAFKVSFLLRCVENQLTPAETHALVKQALDALEGFEKRAFLGGMLSGLVGKTLDAGKGIGQTAMGYGLPLALAAPPILGGLGGYGLARATDVSDTDVSQIKDQEVIDEYRRQTERLRRQKAYRHSQQAQQRPTRALI